MNQRPEDAGAVSVTGLATVGIPVSDQDRALDFYLGTLGLEKLLDVPTPEGTRWIMVAPPGSAGTSLALVAAHGEVRAGVETGIRLTTPDAQGAREVLAARGVGVGDLLRWPGVPAMFAFRDQDGNGLELVEMPAPGS